MRAVTLLAVCLSALLSCGSGDDKRSFISLVELVELDYEDHCERRATASWDELAGKGISAKLETDKAFGLFAKQQTTDVKSAFKSNSLADDDEVFRRKIKLLLKPGDTMLETEQWIRLVTFGDTALHNIRFANDYECDNNVTCNFRELQNSIARQPDEEKLRRMKKSWEKKLPNMSVYLEQILPLLKNASKENGHNTAEEYWDALAEYEGAILKARELWDHIKPLYVKLHKYVAMKLKGPEAVGNPLPVYLFRSLTGDDWSYLIESLLPKHPDVYKKLQVNLHLKGIGGLKAFEQAAKLIQELNMGELDTQVWAESIFNGTCPTTIVDWCKPNRVRVASCKDVSISNYLDAHESAMKVKYKQITAVHSNITYVLREAPRYSAVYEAIPGFASVLALNPHALDRAGLYPLERFNYNPNHNRLVLQLILALRDLPKLNYYLAADEWRLKVLMGEIKASKAASTWNEFRQNFSLVTVSDADILGDPYVLFNKPYIGKFMGLVLKYQIYHSFAEELISDDSDLVEHISANNGRLTEAMMQGFGVLWPEMIRDLLASRENGLEYTGVTDYYRLLDEYLDNQLDPSPDTNQIDDYVEPVTSEPETLDNEISNNQEHVEEIQREPETHESIVNNIIDDADEHPSKFGTETSTSVAVLELQNAPKEEIDNGMNTKTASYNTYWWIGIAIAVAVVLVAIAIIARKRHNHRKELERQRRDTSRA